MMIHKNLSSYLGCHPLLLDKSLQISTKIEWSSHSHKTTTENSTFKLKVVYELKNVITPIDKLTLNSTNLNNIENSFLPQQFRKKDLWKSTCLEFFLKGLSQKEYFEFNLSPLGEWNFYYLMDYRAPLIEAQEVDGIYFESLSSDSDNSINLTTEIDLTHLFSKYPYLIEGFKMAVTAVIAYHPNSITKPLIDYFSIKHPSHQADFHHDDGFQIYSSQGEFR